MKFYPVPIEMEEEKTFGGMLTIRQVVYIFSATIVAVSAFFVFRLMGIHIIAVVLLCAPAVMCGAALAFVTLDDLRLDQYIYHRVHFYMSPRSYYLRGDAE